MDIINVLKSRYATKEFDTEKKITPELMDKIKLLLQLSPSSTNIQPWHFIIASSKEAKMRIAKSTQGFFVFNEKKVLDSSAVIIFSSKISASLNYLTHISDTEQRDGRFSTEDQKAQTHAGRAIFTEMHRYDLKDQQHWLEKQTYLNLGNFLLGVAALGLDALPMEGCNTKVLNEEFGLINMGFTASFIVAVGYKTETDFNAKLPKSRLPQAEIIEEL